MYLRSFTLSNTLLYAFLYDDIEVGIYDHFSLYFVFYIFSLVLYKLSFYQLLIWLLLILIFMFLYVKKIDNEKDQNRKKICE